MTKKIMQGAIESFPLTEVPKPRCPLCSEEIDFIYTSRQQHMAWDGGWSLKIVDTYHTKQCPKCLEELDDQALDSLDVPQRLRK